MALGVDEGKLRTIMALHVTESNINEYGRFNALVETVDKAVAKHYFEKYAKLKRTCEALTVQIQETQQEIEHLNSIGKG